VAEQVGRYAGAIRLTWRKHSPARATLKHYVQRRILILEPPEPVAGLVCRSLPEVRGVNRSEAGVEAVRDTLGRRAARGRRTGAGGIDQALTDVTYAPGKVRGHRHIGCRALNAVLKPRTGAHFLSCPLTGGGEASCDVQRDSRHGEAFRLG
jgi:hypothetical protein